MSNLTSVDISNAEVRASVQETILRDFFVLTKAQRYADWFILRQFIVTGTNLTNIMLQNHSLRQCLRIPERSKLLTNKMSDCKNVFVKSWFSSNRRTEEMMRGSANEGAVLNSLRRNVWVMSIFELGIFLLNLILQFHALQTVFLFNILQTFQKLDFLLISLKL